MNSTYFFSARSVRARSVVTDGVARMSTARPDLNAALGAFLLLSLVQALPQVARPYALMTVARKLNAARTAAENSLKMTNNVFAFLKGNEIFKCKMSTTSFKSPAAAAVPRFTKTTFFGNICTSKKIFALTTSIPPIERGARHIGNT